MPGNEDEPPAHEASRAVASEEDEGRQAAREYFVAYFERQWHKRRDERELSKALEEVNRLRRLYPGLFEEVYGAKLERQRKLGDGKTERS